MCFPVCPLSHLVALRTNTGPTDRLSFIAFGSVTNQSIVFFDKEFILTISEKFISVVVIFFFQQPKQARAINSI